MYTVYDMLESYCTRTVCFVFNLAPSHRYLRIARSQLLQILWHIKVQDTTCQSLQYTHKPLPTHCARLDMLNPSMTPFQNVTPLLSSAIALVGCVQPQGDLASYQNMLTRGRRKAIAIVTIWNPWTHLLLALG